MSLYIQISNSNLASSGYGGRYHAQVPLAAPTGYFIVAGGFYYDNLYGLAADVRADADSHRYFAGSPENLPLEYYVSVSAAVPGTLWAYAVCRELP